MKEGQRPPFCRKKKRGTHPRCVYARHEVLVKREKGHKKKRSGAGAKQRRDLREEPFRKIEHIGYGRGGRSRAKLLRKLTWGKGPRRRV